MQHESLLEEISLLAGVLFSLLAGFSVYTALISNKRSKLLVKKDAESNRLIEQLTESNTELERFAYIASHDMQEPIRMVTNFGEILEAEYGEKLDDTGREYVGFIVNAGTRLRDLVNDLLAYSRMGNENMQFKAFDGELVIKGVLENIQTLTKDKNARITHDTFPELTANPVQIMRLIQNLILNGIKYQPEGNEPHIHVGIEDQHSHWCISVKDNGLGIKDQFIDQIFQPFRRLHAWDAIQGTGLGLSICKKIVENHGGKIWVTSTPAEGSVFYFTIPKTPSKRGKA